jgi:hypothetical protein
MVVILVAFINIGKRWKETCVKIQCYNSGCSYVYLNITVTVIPALNWKFNGGIAINQ